jgi:hypothetical protein
MSDTSNVIDAFGQIYSTDQTKSEKGIDILIGYNAKNEAIKLKVAEAGNPNHERVQRKFSRAIEKARNNKQKRTEVWAQVAAEALLLSWEGVLDKNGNTVEPTLENRIAALTANKKLMSEVLDIAMDPANYMEDADEVPVAEETEKNSKRSSGGKSDTAKN